MSVQFSGGEPTMSPYFLDAIRYSRKVGYNSVQAATNGIEFAKSPEFAKAAAEAGLRYAYLQFDGIGNAANSHRRVGNLFDVKLRAIENLYQAGVDIVPVITIVNGVNNEQVGRVIEFALDNPKRINFLSFQPVSFTGRDEEITPERRAAQRYTLSHLAHDVKNQTGIGEPIRDWFPISFMSTFTDWADVVHGPDREWGQLTCGCHPNCGIGMAVMIDKETKEAVPVTAFLKADQLAKDVAQVNDAARGKFLSVVGMALALMRNYDPFKAPTHFRIADLMKKFDKTFGATGKNYGKVTGDRTMSDIEKRRADRWNFLFIAGMWFQDLFNYDFRRTEMCIIPYGTQQGEISFCAYNTGIGWRNILEKMHMTATLSEVVRRPRPSRDLRRQQERAARQQGALTAAQRRSRGRGPSDGPRRARRRQERARREAGGAQEVADDARGDPSAHGDGAAVSSAGAQGAADDPDPGPEHRRQEEAGRPASDAQGRQITSWVPRFRLRRRLRRDLAEALSREGGPGRGGSSDPPLLCTGSSLSPRSVLRSQETSRLVGDGPARRSRKAEKSETRGEWGHHHAKPDVPAPATWDSTVAARAAHMPRMVVEGAPAHHAWNVVRCVRLLA